jgi:oligosaccharyltransferase complex subunit beta
MIEYHVNLLEWDKKNKEWIAFNDANAQLEFVMLDPYYRISLIQQEYKKPTYIAKFKTPDKYGIFQFKINYTRKGYSYLDLRTQVTKI